MTLASLFCKRRNRKHPASVHWPLFGGHSGWMSAWYWADSVKLQRGLRKARDVLPEDRKIVSQVVV